MSIDLEQLRQNVGKSIKIEDDLAPLHARALAATLDRKELPNPGDALPPLYQWVYFLETPRSEETRGDGHPKSGLGGLLSATLPPRRMFANSTMTFDRPLVLGQRAEKTTTVKAIDHKTGKSGDLVFVTLEHVYTQSGNRCIVEEQSLAYRPMPTAAAPAAPGELPKQEPAFKRTWTPDPVLLFRYSALTLNSHRIHYDHVYTVEKEFFPALVVHGPLLATFLYELVADRKVTKFSLRANRPSYVSRPLTACGVYEGDGAELWTLDDQGFVCVTARAEFSK